MKVLDDALFMIISVSIATVNKYGEKRFFVNYHSFLGLTRDKQINAL